MKGATCNIVFAGNASSQPFTVFSRYACDAQFRIFLQGSLAFCWLFSLINRI